MKTPKGMALPRMSRHTPKAYQGAIVKTASSPQQIIENTPTLKRLYEFLERPLPDGTPPSFHPRQK